MALVKPFVFQIVGYQNSGKTTFVGKLLSCLKLDGIRTATIKHHGHGGKPAVVEDTDSARHIMAGAAASLVEGNGRMIIQIENLDWSLDDKIDFLSKLKPDLILVEGHKYESYPKIVFIRNDHDIQLLKELTNIKAVFYQESLDVYYPFPSFHCDDPKTIKQVVEYLKCQVKT